MPLIGVKSRVCMQFFSIAFVKIAELNVKLKVYVSKQCCSSCTLGEAETEHLFEFVDSVCGSFIRHMVHLVTE
jgi:hypothetical protein